MSKDNDDLTQAENNVIDAIVAYTSRTRDTGLPITSHGGTRLGAGRKPTGRKKLVLYITDEEQTKIKELIAQMRSAITVRLVQKTGNRRGHRLIPV